MRGPVDAGLDAFGVVPAAGTEHGARVRAQLAGDTRVVDGLWAARCGAYKAHYVTNTHLNATPVVHAPPLLYNVEMDVGESYPIDSASDEYSGALATITAAVAAHKASIKPVPNQMGMGTDPKYRACCDDTPPSKYGCTCNPENWQKKPYTGGDIDYSTPKELPGLPVFRDGFFDPYCDKADEGAHGSGGR